MIKCLGRKCQCPGEPDDYTCDHPYAMDVMCDDCVCNGGGLDPRFPKHAQNLSRLHRAHNKYKETAANKEGDFA